MSNPQITIRGTVVKSATEIVQNGAVIVEDDKIVNVGTWEEIKRDYDTSTILGSENHIVAPGFVNTHSHAVQTLFRGAADDLELLPWLENVILPGEGSLTSNQLEASCRIGFAEMLLSGITTTNDMLTAKYSKKGLEAAYNSGIRAKIGKMLMDRNVPDILLEDTEDILQESTGLADQYPKGGRIEYSFTPRFIPACTPKLIEESNREAKERGLMLHTHASENQSECAWVKDLTGKPYIDAMHEYGALGDHVILAHAVWTTEEERQQLTDTKTNISHNPSSNSKLASGIAPIPDYLQRGINVGLATDGSPATGGHDFFLEMRLASFLQKATSNDPTIMPAQQVFDLATRRGALALNYHDVGMIKPGYKADIFVLDPSHPSAFPRYDPLSYIVYTAQTRDISDVMVDGKPLVKNGQLVQDLSSYQKLAIKYAEEKPYIDSTKYY